MTPVAGTWNGLTMLISTSGFPIRHLLEMHWRRQILLIALRSTPVHPSY
jgi:hypothetical protein